jgi:hypothetical protein
MSVHIQNSEHAYGAQYPYAQISGLMLKNMKEENNRMSVDMILHEASTVLQATRQHAAELSEVGVSDEEIHLMRVLITRVAAHNYTSLGNKIDFLDEVRELKIVKEVIVRMAEMRFGHTSNVLNEFKYNGQRKTIV